MNRRDRMGLSEAEPPEFSRHCQPLVRRLALVDRQQHRAVLGPQPLGDGFIRSRDTLLAIHDHQGNTGLGHGEIRLLPDFGQELTVVVKDQSTGVDDLELPVAPVPILVSTVTGHPGLVVDDRLTTATETIHQR